MMQARQEQGKWQGRNIEKDLKLVGHCSANKAVRVCWRNLVRKGHSIKAQADRTEIWRATAVRGVCWCAQMNITCAAAAYCCVLLANHPCR